MPSERFPYDLPGQEALVHLINESYPAHNLDPKTTAFELPFFSPTSITPGRTFIEAEATMLNRKHWFVYRRLDLAVAFPTGITIDIEGQITPAAIVAEVNRAYEMSFDASDVRMDHTALVPLGYSVAYRLRALPTSLVWYGSIIVDVNAVNVPLFARVGEDDEYRFTEDDGLRLMEQQFA